VTGPIRDIGQSVLQSYLETGSSSSYSYCHILFLIAFLEEAIIKNTIAIFSINYIIFIIFIVNNNAVINNYLWKIPIPYFAP
jgi:hypothetical protein